MVQYDLKPQKGFSVVHGSETWRMASHSFEPTVNGVDVLKDWGIHVDSEEAFTLLRGKGMLIIQNEKKEPVVVKLQPLQTCVVAAGERHAIILDEDTNVLIMENYDMSRFETEPIDEKTLTMIRNEWKKFA